MEKATRKKNEKSIQQAMHTPKASSRSRVSGAVSLGRVSIDASLVGGCISGVVIGVVRDAYRHANYEGYDCHPKNGAVPPVSKAWHMRLLFTIYL